MKRLFSRRRRLSSTSGAAIPEFAMAILPVMITVFGMMQWSIIAYVHLIVRHAAFVAARCEAVVNPAMKDSGEQDDCTRSAMAILFKHVAGVQEGDVKVDRDNVTPESQGMNTVTVKLDYKCMIPLGRRIACSKHHGAFMPLEEKAEFPNQGSAYQHMWGAGK